MKSHTTSTWILRRNFSSTASKRSKNDHGNFNNVQPVDLLEPWTDSDDENNQKSVKNEPQFSKTDGNSDKCLADFSKLIPNVEPMPPRTLSHLNSEGRASMVDVGAKAVTQRTAIAECEVEVPFEVMQLLELNKLKKGDALTVAQLAGVMAAKKTYADFFSYNQFFILKLTRARVTINNIVQFVENLRDSDHSDDLFCDLGCFSL